MKYCKKCLQPDTRPGIKFNEEGVCYACLYEEEKKKIDWGKRENELQEITKWAKEEAKRRNAPYDCIIGISGGKDSTYQALYAKEKLGLKTLLVNNTPDNMTDIGTHNLENLRNYGFDLIQMRPDPNVMKALTKRDFYKYCNPVKSSEYSLWSSAYIIAVKFDIPLVIQGENPNLVFGIVDGSGRGGDALSIRDYNTLSGANAKDIECEGAEFEKLYMFNFPSKEEIEDKNIKAVFLQYYSKEWSQVKNADFAISRGLWGRAFEDLHDIGRYRRFTSLDSNAHVLNQMLKYYKFGFGFATDEACYDIREGRLTREEALWLVKEYDGKCGEQYIEEFCDSIDITKEEFWILVDKFVNKKLFEKDEKTGKWIPKFEVGIDFDEK